MNQHEGAVTRKILEVISATLSERGRQQSQNGCLFLSFVMTPWAKVECNFYSSCSDSEPL